MLRVASLGSGSKGNATLIQSKQTTLLVDCGFSLRETETRLTRLGCTGDQIDAILVTHEHSDHLKGVAAVANKYNLPVWLSYGTASHRHAERICHPVIINRFLSPFPIGDIQVTAVPVPHDAAEACQFLFACDSMSLGLLTDLGHISPLVEQYYAEVQMLLMEFNYDQQMLATGPYPWHLKQRVGGDYGHLGNHQAIEFVSSLAKGQLRHLVAMHISEKNNDPMLVEALLRNVQNAQEKDKLSYLMACQNQGFDWQSLTRNDLIS